MAKANPFAKKAAPAKAAAKSPAAKKMAPPFGKGGKGMVPPPGKKAK